MSAPTRGDEDLALLSQLPAEHPPRVRTLDAPGRAYVALAVGVFCIAWSAIFVRWAGVSGPVSAFYRMAVAALVLVPWRLAVGTHRPRPSRAAVRAALVAGAFFAADLGLYNTAILKTSATNATLLGNNAPVFVALGGWLLFRERPTREFWIGFVLTSIGLLAIVGADVFRHPTLGVGDAMALTGAACYAGYLLFIQRSRSSAMDALTFTTIASVVSALLLLLTCLALGAPLGGFSARSWGALIALGLVSQVIGHLTITYAMGHLPATVTSVILLAQAPITAVLAVPLLGESISGWQVVGGVLTLAGIYVVNRPVRGRV